MLPIARYWFTTSDRPQSSLEGRNPCPNISGGHRAYVHPVTRAPMTQAVLAGTANGLQTGSGVWCLRLLPLVASSCPILLISPLIERDREVPDYVRRASAGESISISPSSWGCVFPWS